MKFTSAKTIWTQGAIAWVVDGTRLFLLWPVTTYGVKSLPQSEAIVVRVFNVLVMDQAVISLNTDFNNTLDLWNTLKTEQAISSEGMTAKSCVMEPVESSLSILNRTIPLGTVKATSLVRAIKEKDCYQRLDVFISCGIVIYR
jgi:hypothetical protein